MLFEYLNSAACAVLLACMFPVAAVADPRRHPAWVILMVVVEVMLCMNIIAPFLSWPIAVGWPTASLHVAQAVCIVVLRKRFWLFVRAEFGDTHTQHQMRRVDDLRGAV